LPSGIKVAVLPKPTRDEEVNVSLTLHYGNADNLKELREAAAFLPALMNRGTRRLSYQQLKDEMNRLDVQVTAGGGGGGRGGRGFRGGSGPGAAPGTISFSVRARRKSLPAALDLLQQIVREPALDEKELDLMKPSRIAAREESRTDPGSLASDLLARTLNPYPPDNVRANLTADEEIARIQAVTIDQVRRVHREFLGAQHGELVIVGDFDPEPTLKQISGILADWTPTQPYARIERQAFDVPGGRHSILTPDKANANYAAGLTIAMNDQDPDYAALLIGNFILGGGSLSSRLGDRIRQKEGLSYGVGSGLTAGTEDKVARLMIGAICNPANMGKVEKAVREELDRLLKDGITAEELDKAKQAWLQSRELARSSDSFLAERLERGLRLDQTLAYEAALEAKVASLTPDDVHAALRKHIDPQRLVVVAAGDFAGSGGDNGKQ
jgi:zinc protease